MRPTSMCRAHARVRRACRPAPPRRNAAQRGIVAAVTACLLPFIVGLMILVSDVGLLYLHRQELRNAAEAQALAYSLSMVSSADNGALPDNNPPELTDLTQRSSRWTTGNGADHADWQFNRPARTQEWTGQNPWQNSLNWYDWAPRSLAQFKATHAPITNFFANSGTTSPWNLVFYATSIIPQYQWNQFYPVRTRIILLLDFSTTMRQTFQNNPSLMAITVLKNAVQMVVDGTDPSLRPFLPYRINWGAILFAQNILGAPIDLVPLPNTNTIPVPYADQAVYQTNNDLIATTVRNQRAGLPPGVPDLNNDFRTTNLAGAVDRALAMLKTHDQTGSAFAQKYLKGPAYLLIISDGEPDYQPGAGWDVASRGSRTGYARDQAVKRIDTDSDSAWKRGYKVLSIMTETGVLGDLVEQRNFVRSISGDGASNPAWALEANDTAHLGQNLAAINPATRCLAYPQMQMPTQNRQDFWATPPLNIDPVYLANAHYGDNFYGYAVPFRSATGAAETQVTRWRDTTGTLDPNADGSPMGYPTGPQDQKFYVYPSDAGQENAGTNMVELNASICIPAIYYSRSGNTGQVPVFRARWGYPNLWWEAGTPWPW